MLLWRLSCSTCAQLTELNEFVIISDANRRKLSLFILFRAITLDAIWLVIASQITSEYLPRLSCPKGLIYRWGIRLQEPCCHISKFVSTCRLPWELRESCDSATCKRRAHNWCFTSQRSTSIKSSVLKLVCIDCVSVVLCIAELVLEINVHWGTCHRGNNVHLIWLAGSNFTSLFLLDPETNWKSRLFCLILLLLTSSLSVNTVFEFIFLCHLTLRLGHVLILILSWSKKTKPCFTGASHRAFVLHIDSSTE